MDAIIYVGAIPPRLAATEGHQDGLNADLASLGTNASVDADLTPQKQTPAVGAGAAGDQDDRHRDLDRADAERKRRARLQAVAAMEGIALHQLTDGSWLACRWNLTKALADTDVEAWLARAGVRA